VAQDPEHRGHRSPGGVTRRGDLGRLEAGDVGLLICSSPASPLSLRDVAIAEQLWQYGWLNKPRR
jgi:hypothetical protein